MGAPVATESRRPKTALAKAVAHPIRATSLVMMAERPTSPAEVARHLDIETSNVSWHVGALAEAGLIEEVGTRRVRGATEHFYRAIDRPFTTSEEEADLEPGERRSWAETILSLFAANASHALETGTLLARDDFHLTRKTMNLDLEGWRRCVTAYMDLFERVEEIEVDAAVRMGVTGEKPMRVITFQAAFEIPDIRPEASG